MVQQENNVSLAEPRATVATQQFRSKIGITQPRAITLFWQLHSTDDEPSFQCVRNGDAKCKVTWVF